MLFDEPNKDQLLANQRLIDCLQQQQKVLSRVLSLCSRLFVSTISESNLLLHHETSSLTSPIILPTTNPSTMGSGVSLSNPVAYHKMMLTNVGVPLTLFSLMAAFYSSYVLMGYNWIWFSWHPSSMIIAYVAMAGNAALIKKVGGYDNTKNHGLIMIVATLLACFAFYVIYSNKNLQKKQHFTTLHGKLGLGVMLGYLGLGLFGAIGLNPDWGYVNKNKQLRMIHKFSGRLVTFMAWLCCVLGFQTLEKDIMYQGLFAVPLLAFSYFVLL